MGKKPYNPKSINSRRRQKKKDNKKKTVTIKNKVMKESWDAKLSVSKNLDKMGLGMDPNKVVKMETVRDKLKKQILMENGQVRGGLGKLFLIRSFIYF